MNLKELKQQYPEEWLLVEVIDTDPDGTPSKVQLVHHSRDRDETYEALLRVQKGQRVYHFFNGPIPKKGYAVAF